MGGIVFRREWAGRFRDEAPQAYRDLREVMQAQRELVRTTATLLPILNDKRP
jgi:RNA-splicing ligase RtcB